MSLSYAAVTPVRDEAVNLRRLAECMASQALRPTVWVIVDNGSSDGTVELAQELASEHEWIATLVVPGAPTTTRGGPIARAFHAGLPLVPADADVVVKLDADVSFAHDYFERLIGEFERDATLGIASGTCYEWDRDAWRPRFSTRDQVRGATRAYRRACLTDVLPLEERMGWDSVDQLVALLRGWRTESVRDIPFYHHRFTGERDGSARAWRIEGDLAHFLGYRPSYLLARTAYRMLKHPTAITMVWGYSSAALRNAPQCQRADVIRLLRRQQSLRELPRRAREALGRT